MPVTRRGPKRKAGYSRVGSPLVVGLDPAVATWHPILVGMLLALCALVLYMWRLNQPGWYVFDEVYHAYTAAQLVVGNPDALMWITKAPQGVAYEWTHPPLAKYFMEAAILVWGDNTWGWRLASSVFGAAGVGLVYALGLVLFDQRTGMLAATLLLLDGLWFVMARTAMNDVFMVDFVLLAFLVFIAYWKHATNHRMIWLVGVALGLGIATKWSAMYAWVCIGTLTAYRELWCNRAARPASWIVPLVRLVGALVIVPVAMYLLSYAQFFAFGYSLSQWVALQWQMWSYHTNLKAVHDWQSPAWSWPLLIKPVWFYSDIVHGSVANVWALGNPLIWWALLPSLVVVYRRWRHDWRHRFAFGIVLLGFVGQWLPWFFSPRLTFLYHMMPSLPFGCLAIAVILRSLPNRRIVWAYLLMVLVTFVFFYPQYAAMPVTQSYAAWHYWLPGWDPR